MSFLDFDQHHSSPNLNPDELKLAWEKWRWSEWVLSFLKTEGSSEPKTPTNEEILLWARKQ